MIQNAPNHRPGQELNGGRSGWQVRAEWPPEEPRQAEFPFFPQIPFALIGAEHEPEKGGEN